MDKLFVVRHGEYGTDGKLTPAGRSAMGVLAQKIAGITRGPLQLFYSPLPRTLESAIIISNTLEAILYGEPILNVQDNQLSDYSYLGIRGVLDSSKTDSVVFVTHVAVANEFIPRYAHDTLRLNVPERFTMDKAECGYLNVRARAYMKLRPIASSSRLPIPPKEL